MEVEAFKFIAVGLMAFGMLGAAIGVGNIFAAMITAIARNPSAEDKLKTYVYVGFAVAEFMGIISAGIAFLLMYTDI